MHRRNLYRFALPVALFLAPSGAFAQDQLEAAVENDLVLEMVQSGLNGPTAAEFLPDGRIMFISQNSGDVFVYDEAQAGSPEMVGSLTIQNRGNERGLLGMVVDPEFATSNRIYFYHSLNNTQRVVWVAFNPTTNVLDVANPTLVLDGLASSNNHNGGGLQFGPDGNLYIGVGDTGCNCGCSPGTNTNNYFGTCLTNFNGKILRVDRDGNVPAGNPLIGETNVADCFTNNCNQSAAPTATGMPRTEIYNWGFRNPWRFTFDEQTGNLWVGDVGEVTWEEITISTGPGQHHGWPYREGDEGQAVTTCATTTPQSSDCKEPAFRYAGQGSVSGGVFANHCSWPEPWHGRYFFGDYVQNRTWYLDPNPARDGVVGDRVRVVRHGAGGGPVHYFNGPSGAVYFNTVNDGEIWRIRPANPVDCGMDGGVRDAGDRDAGGGIDGALVDDASVFPPLDAGSRDAGQGTPRDAGDGTGVKPGGETDEGCSCSNTKVNSAGVLGFFALIALTMISRRRR